MKTFHCMITLEVKFGMMMMEMFVLIMQTA